MVRKTKEEAEQTRLLILDAARTVFSQYGVSRTSLQQIAQQAGVTRGAIYWHFTNKQELFFAMREQVSLPLLDNIEIALADNEDDPLRAVEQFLQRVITTLETDERTRVTFDITTSKCEYVEEFASLKDEQFQSCNEFIQRIAKLYRLAKQKNIMKPEIGADIAAIETCSFLYGTIKLWIADKQSVVIRPLVAELIAAHVLAKRV